MSGKHARPNPNADQDTSADTPDHGNTNNGPNTTGTAGPVTIIGGDQINAGNNVTINNRGR